MKFNIFLNPIKNISIKLFLIVLFPLLPLSLFSQDGGNSFPDSDSLFSMYIKDSLTETSRKFDDGTYYAGLVLSHVAGSRLSINYNSYGPNYKDILIILKNDNDKVKYYRSGLIGGRIDLDTTFSESAKLSIYFTTQTAGTKFHYDATLIYASPSALTWYDDAPFCWKLQYVLKQSDNGFKFIKGGLAGGLFNVSSYTTTAPIKTGFSFIESGVGSTFYRCTIGRGTKEQADDAFKKATGALFECLNHGWTYENSVDENGLAHFSATMDAPTSGVTIHNLSYLEKTDSKLPKYRVYLFLQENKVDGKVVSYDLVLQVVNDFMQY